MLKVTKYISTFIGVQTIYDDDIKIVDKEGKKAPVPSSNRLSESASPIRLRM